MAAAATGLRFLSAGAMCEIVLELGEAYSRASGIKLSGEFTRSPLVRDRIRSGEAFDIIVTTKSNIEQLVRENKVLSDSAAVLARSHIGVAVKSGRPKPDISTVDGFRQHVTERQVDCVCRSGIRHGQRTSLDGAFRPSRIDRGTETEVAPGRRRGRRTGRRLRRGRRRQGRTRNSADCRDRCGAGRRGRWSPARGVTAHDGVRGRRFVVLRGMQIWRAAS